VRAGALRHRITIERLTEEFDSDDGVVSESWEPFAGPLSAEIVALSGRELIAAQAVQSKVSTRIRIRNRPGVVSKMRVLHREAIYSIVAVLPDPVSGVRYMTLMCETGVNEG
jgi:SPP1 family predicted phage head-tail adaptor